MRKKLSEEHFSKRQEHVRSATSSLLRKENDFIMTLNLFTMITSEKEALPV